MERIEISTEDGVQLVADWYPCEEGAKKNGVERFALLLHMMPADRHSWKAFAERLNGRGISCLAIDQRGHGESTQVEDGRKLDYQEFSDEEQQAKAFDVEASLLWLQEKGMTGDKLAVVGASIGANLTIHAMAANNLIRAGIALSPGLDYKGVKTEEPIQAIGDGQTLLLVASEDDEYSFESVNALHTKNPTHAFRIIEETLGHGTTMFENDPKLLDQCVDWIDQTLV